MDAGDVREQIGQTRDCLQALEWATRVCPPWPWHPGEDGDVVMAVDEIPVADGFALSGGQLRAAVLHIATWDPGRVLGTIAADRMVLDLYERAPSPELLEVVLAVIGKYEVVPTVDGEGCPTLVDEYAIAYRSGDMQVRCNDPEVEEEYPLERWIPNRQRGGGKVYRRRVVVVDDWQEVPRVQA